MPPAAPPTGPRPVRSRSAGGLQLVAGDLPADEAVERHVLIERLDDAVAVLVRVWAVVVVFVAGAFAEAGDVEPVPAPALAVVRRGEQAVDETFVGVGRLVTEPSLDFLARRRQADQVEVGAADERAAV